MQKYEPNEFPDGAKRELAMISRVYDWAKPKADKLERSYEQKPSVATRNALRHYTDILWLCHYAEATVRGNCSHCEQRWRNIRTTVSTLEEEKKGGFDKIDIDRVIDLIKALY